MTYRRDIDGLRAIAVIAVVLFHFGYVSGGFVGVDVFFVISGYLITKIINDEVNNGSFSAVNFYMRRIRRIFPAIFVLYFAVMIITFLFAFSPDARDVSKSVQSSIFFLSNIFFYGTSGYFEDKNALRPLLHTWSLSVEEQFYIVLPLLMYLLGRFALRLRYAVLWAIAGISLVASAWMVRNDTSAAFYLMQFRAWEFLAGSLLAVGAVPAIRRRNTAEWLGILGLVLMCASAAAMTRRIPFPGLTALPPCLGAALIIHSGRDYSTRVSRLLSLPGMVFVGLISYSLYLWHWPVLGFYSYIVATPGHVQKILLIVLSFGIAVLSWRYVETPCRALPLESGRFSVFAGSATVMILTSVFSMPLAPLVRRVWAEPAQITNTLSYIRYKRHGTQKDSCFLNSQAQRLEDFDQSICLNQSNSKPNFLIIGDSHADHLRSGLVDLYPNVNFLQATAAGCKPIVKHLGKSRCFELWNFIFNEFLPDHHLDGIILSSRWKENNIDGLKRTIQILKRFADRIIVFGPIVEYERSLPRILAISMRSGDKYVIDKYRKISRKNLDRKMARELKDTQVEYISIYDQICATECTVLVKNDIPLQYDYGHLTAAGSHELARRLRKQLFLEQKSTRTQ